MNPTWLGAALGTTLGTAAAALVGEGLGMSAFCPGPVRAIIGMTIAASLGALQGTLMSYVFRADRGAGSLGLFGGVFAALLAILLLRTATFWLDLSVFGAAPAGTLAFFVLPVTQALVGAVLGSLAGEGEKYRWPLAGR